MGGAQCRLQRVRRQECSRYQWNDFGKSFYKKKHPALRPDALCWEAMVCAGYAKISVMALPLSPMVKGRFEGDMTTSFGRPMA